MTCTKGIVTDAEDNSFVGKHLKVAPARQELGKMRHSSKYHDIASADSIHNKVVRMFIRYYTLSASSAYTATRRPIGTWFPHLRER